MKKEVADAINVLKEATANCAAGDRHIVVLDRGWIFAGSMSFDKDTKVYTVTNCTNIRKWSKGGFGLLSKDAKESEAVLDDCATIRFGATAMIFCVPISDDWGV